MLGIKKMKFEEENTVRLDHYYFGIESGEVASTSPCEECSFKTTVKNEDDLILHL